jgi:serine/threonine protein kinase
MNGSWSEKLGKYNLLEKLGEGGFGIVYKARDPLHERDVAIKVLKSDAAASSEIVERFAREARLAASLRHDSIVNVVDVGEHDGRYYLVMDFLPGGTLADLIARGKPLSSDRTIELLRPVADALDYIHHEKQLIHRDFKPSNIILDENGAPVLTDFGLGKTPAVPGGSSTTGVEFGTVEYMAPEQILGKPTTPATDLYALGIVAYQLLTGKVPFGGNTLFAVQKGHVEEPPPDPRQLNPALSKYLSPVLLRSLEKDAARRFESGAAFMEALGAATNAAAPQKPKSAPYELWGPFSPLRLLLRTSATHRWVPTALIGLVASLVGILAMLAWPKAPYGALLCLALPLSIVLASIFYAYER